MNLSKLNLKDHQDNVHDGKAMSCQKCDYKTTSKKVMKEHMSNVHNRTNSDRMQGKGYEIELKCVMCQFSSKNEEDQKKHQREKHEYKRSYQCNLCDFTATTKDILKKHMKIAMAHKKNIPCRYYKKNQCMKGNACKYQHVSSDRLTQNFKAQSSQCKYYANCRDFPDCRNNHYEICKYGEDCRFFHLRPATFLEFIRNSQKRNM